MKKTIILMFLTMALPAFSSGTWNEERLESLLRTSGRFVESDDDENGLDDIPNWERNALPLFQDVIEESGWSTNQLIQSLINVASNGMLEANWQIPEKRKAASIAFAQLADINHPLVTNYFHSIVGYDLHGLESIVYPALFKYTCLESDVFPILYSTCIFTNGFNKAAPEVAMGLLDGLEHVPSISRIQAEERVAKFLYFSMRQIDSSQTWQDEQLARLIPDYSNSVERLEQMRYLKNHASRPYEREKASLQFDRLTALPSNTLNSVQWITDCLP